MYSFRFLSPSDVPQMYDAFINSFSDYQIPLQLTRSQFEKKFVEKLNISFDYSVGAFTQEGLLVGFIFTAISDYEGQKTAYNGGTGVRPGFRGNRLTQSMYDHLFPVLKAQSVTQCVLEVLTNNLTAIKTYQGIGFVKSKYFHCFRLNRPPYWLEQDYPFSLQTVDKPDWKTYLKFTDYLPSFLDTESMINRNLANENIIEAIGDDELVGYAIYQPGPGRISHIGVRTDYRRKGVATSLVKAIYEDSENKGVSVININKEAVSLKKFFMKLGFENQLDQFEMKLEI